jgi:hypothetical protein
VNAPGDVRSASPPPSHQGIVVGNVGCIFKLDLKGKILGEFGDPGRSQGLFDSGLPLAMRMGRHCIWPRS